MRRLRLRGRAMLRAWRWQHWGIGARLIFITILPIGLMFCSVGVYTYLSRLAEARDELAERGAITATALADSSEYGLISGNLSDLRRIANALVQADKNIFQIDVLNAARATLLHIHCRGPREAETRVFEAPVKRLVLAIADYSDSAPAVSGHVSRSASGSDNLAPSAFQAGSVAVGYVRVTMSPSHMFALQRQRVYVQSTMALFVLFLSAALALYLGRSLRQPLAAIGAGVRQIRGGDYSVLVRVTTGGEIGDLQASINAMSVSLEQSKQDLENKVKRRTSELEASRNDALRSDAEKRRLIQKINSIVEDERRSIAVEIHDELNATLIAARLHSQRILGLAQKAGDSAAIVEIRAKAESIIKLTLDLYASARSIVRRLRPEVLDMLGLHGAVEEMMAIYDRAGTAQFNFQSAGDFARLDSVLAITAYRLIQEALSNVVKHAAASTTMVTLFLIEDETRLQITITDNGAGFNAQATSEGIGLIGMRERVFGVDGTLVIRSAIGQGTEITMTLPVQGQGRGQGRGQV